MASTSIRPHRCLCHWYAAFIFGVVLSILALGTSCGLWAIATSGWRTDFLRHWIFWLHGAPCARAGIAAPGLTITNIASGPSHSVSW